MNTCACGALYDPKPKPGPGRYRTMCRDCADERKREQQRDANRRRDVCKRESRPRKKSGSCTGCGNPVYRGTRYCNPCRRAGKAPRKSRRLATCEGCGAEFMARVYTTRPSQRFCSSACRSPRATCQQCGVEFTIRRDRKTFCSRECSYAYRTLDRLTRQGWFGPRSMRLTIVSCDWCMKVMVSRNGRKTCSDDCRTRRLNAKARQYAKAKPPKIWSMRTWHCWVCGADFLQPEYVQDARYCSKRCRRALKGGHIERAKLFGVPWVAFDPHTIYERDEWMCGICGDQVDKFSKWPDQMCPSLDHVIPMSEGGPHTPDNSRLAHWLCNSLRGATDIDFLVA